VQGRRDVLERGLLPDGADRLLPHVLPTRLHLLPRDMRADHHPMFCLHRRLAVWYGSMHGPPCCNANATDNCIHCGTPSYNTCTTSPVC
jgi:hypothetical protein